MKQTPTQQISAFFHSLPAKLRTLLDREHRMKLWRSTPVVAAFNLLIVYLLYEVCRLVFLWVNRDLYADTITPSMRAAMDETERRRGIQDRFNQEHGITPKTIIKGVREVLEISAAAEEDASRSRRSKKLSKAERDAEIKRLEKEMKEASKMLEFEYAAVLRDRIIELRGEK